MSTQLIKDWATPRSAAAFTGYSGGASDGPGGPAGTLLLCVANTPIPCTADGMEQQKSIMLTVINVHKKGWAYAPWKKPTGKAKAVRDENRKDLFEYGEWAKDDITMERVGQSVKMYSFLKDGLSKGERVDSSCCIIAAGQTFRVMLKGFMFEAKKTEGQQVFPSNVETIPAFSVVEVMISPSHTESFEKGYGFHLSRVRACEFSLYSLHSPLGLGLLPPNYDASLRLAESFSESGAGYRSMLETKNTGFFGQVRQGSYLVKYSDDLYRLVGPKETPDEQARHLNVMDGVFFVDVPKEALLHFTNAGAGDDEQDALNYAHFLVDLASAAGALDCYVLHNEYAMRADQNRSPYIGVPLVDTRRLLDLVKPDMLPGPRERMVFPLPFPMPNMDGAFLSVDCTPVSSPDAGPLQCPDFVLASAGSRAERAYTLRVGDAQDGEIMSLLFVPKTMASCGKKMLERVDYRQFKRARVAVDSGDE